MKVFNVRVRVCKRYQFYFYWFNNSQVINK